MTTSPDHREEPLDAEERDLAARLERVGPFDGPPPRLDAKILAAAHAAAGTRTSKGRRGLAWFGIPPVLVTGIGVAAASVLALGLVWQLRPHYSGGGARSEADAGEEVILIAEPVDSAAAPASEPQQQSKQATAAPTETTRPEIPHPGLARQASSKTTAPAPAPPSPANVAPAAEPVAAAAPAPSEAYSRVSGTVSDQGFAAEAPASAESDKTTAVAPRSHATYTTAARATAERRERAAAAAQVASDSAAEEERATLDRIEVTGSRIAKADVDWSQLPVSEDTHLTTAEWLERIRARRDGGDADSARASLRLFQREHPRIRLPDDLRALLADAKR